MLELAEALVLLVAIASELRPIPRRLALLEEAGGGTGRQGVGRIMDAFTAAARPHLLVTVPLHKRRLRGQPQLPATGLLQRSCHGSAGVGKHPARLPALIVRASGHLIGLQLR